MSAVAVDHDHEAYEADVGHPTVTGISNEKLGMWVFLASECLMFGGLISTYLLYKNRPGEVEGIAGSNVKVSDVFDIGFTSASTFVLLTSSMTMVLAVTAARRAEMDKVKLWLGTTAALGSIFIAGQIYEFTAFLREGLGYTTNVSTSAFYTLTGFHGVHVSAGIVMLLIALGFAVTGRLQAKNWEAVEIVGLYWHFVDVVWIVIFTIVYLIP